MNDTAAWLAEIAAKVAVYLSVLAAVGVAGARFLAHGSTPDVPHARDRIDRQLRQRAAWTAAAFFVATCLRALAHTAAVFGPPARSALWTIVAESRWGRGWRWQMAASFLLMLAAMGVRRPRAASWLLYAAAAVLCCVSLPLLGHAGGSTTRLVIHALHVAAAGLWIGTLAVVFSLLPRLRAIDVSLPSRLLARFAALALPGAAVLAASGTAASLLYVHEFSHLYDSAYGRTLLVKLLLVALVAICGWFNWRTSRQGRTTRFAIVASEVAIALLVVVVTGVLTELEHP